MPNIVAIGFFNDEANNYPLLSNINSIEIDHNQDFNLAKLIHNAVKENFVSIHYKGYSSCRLCNCMNGSITYSYYEKSSNTTFMLPEGYFHYVLDHHLKLNQSLIDLYHRHI
jgi:hypothetical protein